MPDAPPRPEPFTPQTAPAALEDLRARLRATRWPDTPEDAGWSLGTDLGYLRELVAYWADGFDWPAQEAALARLPRFRVPLGDLRIHFVHVRAAAPAGPVLPLVLSHGWPDSFWRYAKVIPLLTDPGAHGADPADAFDVVVPDMPGYGYSDRPTGPPLDSIAVAGLWAELMGVLGYPRFGAAGGDIGSHVSRYLALDHPGRVVAVHRTDAGLPVFTGDPADLAPEERAWLEERRGLGRDRGRLRRHAPHEAPDRRLRAHRLASRARRVDRREAPGVERLRRRRRAALHEGRDPHERHALLAHRDDRLVDAHVPRERRDPARAARPPGRGAVRLLALPRRHRPPAAGVARAHGERRARDRARARRALRAVRGARALRGGAARVLPPLPGGGGDSARASSGLGTSDNSKKPG